MSIVAKTQENLKMCKCMSCPSYTTSCKIKEMPHNVIEELKGIENTDSLENLFCKSSCYYFTYFTILLFYYFTKILMCYFVVYFRGT